MNLFCEYCCEKYDHDTYLPFTIECGHTLCKNCINIIQKKLEFSSCPIDHKKIKISEIRICDEILLKTTICQGNIEEITGFCFSHTTKLCIQCEWKHECCNIIKGNPEKINNNIDEKLKEIKNYESLFLKLDINGYINDEIQWIKEDILNELNILKNLQGKFKLKDISESTKISILTEYNSIQDIDNISLQKHYDSFNQLFNLESIRSEALEKLMHSDKIREDRLIFIRRNMDEVHEELVWAKNNENCAKLFPFHSISKEIDQTYTIIIYNKGEVSLSIHALGIGRPSDNNYLVLVHKIAILKDWNNIIYGDTDSHIIEYLEGRMTEEVYLKQSIVFSAKSKLIFSIEIQGEGNNIFSKHYEEFSVEKPDEGPIELKDINDEEYLEKFPVLYLSY